jgi:GNAT superfamily N-acetyltransferase
VGFIDVVELEGEHSKVEIDPVAVLPEYKNKRIGSQLMDKALVWCKKKRYKTVRAVVSVKAGDRLHNFFEKKDFN